MQGKYAYEFYDDSPKKNYAVTRGSIIDVRTQRLFEL